MRFHLFWKKFIGATDPGKGYVPSARANRVLRSAKAQADKARRATTLTDIAVALLASEAGGADAVLKSFPIDRNALLEAVQREPSAVPAEQIVALADTERRWLGHLNVGTEHLLLALVTHGNNPVGNLFASQRIDARSLRVQLQKKLDPNFSD